MWNRTFTVFPIGSALSLSWTEDSGMTACDKNHVFVESELSPHFSGQDLLNLLFVAVHVQNVGERLKGLCAQSFVMQFLKALKLLDAF